MFGDQPSRARWNYASRRHYRNNRRQFIHAKQTLAARMGRRVGNGPHSQKTLAKSVVSRHVWRMGSPTIVIEIIGIFPGYQGLPTFLPMSAQAMGAQAIGGLP